MFVQETKVCTRNKNRRHANLTYRLSYSPYRWSASESCYTVISSNNVCSLHMIFYSSTDTGITEKCVILHPFTVYQTLISCGPFIYHKGLWLCQPFSHHIRNDSPFLHPGYGGGYVAAVCTDLPFCIRLSLDDGSSALA